MILSYIVSCINLITSQGFDITVFNKTVRIWTAIAGFLSPCKDKEREGQERSSPTENLQETISNENQQTDKEELLLYEYYRCMSKSRHGRQTYEKYYIQKWHMDNICVSLSMKSFLHLYSLFS